jgi:ATP-dependent DNA helicase RecQ
MRRFVEENECRHRQICLYFGETPKWERCDACDVCGSKPEWLEEDLPVAEASPLATAEARKSARKRMAASVPVDSDLRDALRAWRLKLARELSVPAYVILHDATLDALSKQEPRTIAELLEVQGIGEKKAERFGQAILGVITAHSVK